MDRELARLADQGLIWILSMDARDIKEVVVLKSGMLEKLNILCNDQSCQKNINQDEHAVVTEFFGGTQKNMENRDIYVLFREFLLSHGKALRYITRSHFIEFEQFFLENRDMDTPDEVELKQRLVNYKNHNGLCALWEHRNLLMSAGYLTLVLEATNTGTLDEAEKSFGESGSFRCAAVVSSSSEMNGIIVDDDTKLQSFKNQKYEKEQDPVFRLSLPNVGALLSTIRVTRKWILDTIMNRRRSSGDHNVTITPVAASSHNNFRQITQPMLFEKWTIKRKSTAFYYKFKGINLEYVLEEAYGGGWIEPFKTPAGVCWKYTGKTVSI
ncbi:uncharacterized protein SAPINGB_P003708 [Magnusiomyces paraingens]|uniref:Uncharacterized protein n=1 Tax=Magnusiomyces paraingens TaxID=2606893 RepID=A0A5E8BY64_9ASCO|nr:uncharacterized protein SAPINGB_P003708 [Saprochaete ingens]VVT53705.1 unnamed protein product [Saprochaete ingens]